MTFFMFTTRLRGSPGLLKLGHADALTSECILNAFHSVVHYFLTQPGELHLCKPLLPVLDLCLHDYSRRLHLLSACPAQIVRAVHAARHAAYEFYQWKARYGSADIVVFSSSTFGSTIDPNEIWQMVRDGQRLDWLVSMCRDPYIPFVLALDWNRWHRSSDSELLLAVNEFLSFPITSGLMRLLSWNWPEQSFKRYQGKRAVFKFSLNVPANDLSDEITLFRQLNPHQQLTLLTTNDVQCWNCPSSGSLLRSTSEACAGCAIRGATCMATTRQNRESEKLMQKHNLHVLRSIERKVRLLAYTGKHGSHDGLDDGKSVSAVTMYGIMVDIMDGIDKLLLQQDETVRGKRSMKRIRSASWPSM